VAEAKKTTKAKKAPAKKKTPAKKAAVKAPATKSSETVAEISKSANKTKNSGFGVAFVIAGIITLAVVAALVLGNQNQQLAALTSYQGSEYSIDYPEDWTISESGEQVEFYSGDSSENSASGLAVLDSGVVPGYTSLDDTQKEQLVELAIQSVRDSDDTITNEFSEVETSVIEVGNHPAGEQTIRFEFKGTLAEGGQGTLIGFMVITDTGASYVIFTGGNSDVYEANSTAFNDMLQSFKPTQ